MTHDALVVGWRERVGLPAWGIRSIHAKLDTGARTSALHVAELRSDGKRVSFVVVTSRRDGARRIEVTAPIARIARVRSSNGAIATRFVVRTRLRLGAIEREIEVTLVDRGEMIHRMLIGRSGLDGLAVAPDRRYLCSRPPRARPSEAP
ncbi:MAG: RimK/LysX family protein [Deltaproteobacteria bacterium]|nr:RimK/LysX family protein [Deltaproteobacteria bacterium]